MSTRGDPDRSGRIRFACDSSALEVWLKIAFLLVFLVLPLAGSIWGFAHDALFGQQPQTSICDLAPNVQDSEACREDEDRSEEAWLNTPSPADRY